MSARKSSHRTIFLIVSSGSPLALIASSLRSTSKNPVCPMARSLHPPMAHCGQRVRFVATWREEFFKVPSNNIVFTGGQTRIIVGKPNGLQGSIIGAGAGLVLDDGADAFGNLHVTWQQNGGTGKLSLVDNTTGNILTSFNLVGQYDQSDFSASSDGGVGTQINITNPSPPAGTTAAMTLRNFNTGVYEIYDIGGNTILSAHVLGAVGLDWGFAGLGHFFGNDTSDMLLRNGNTGAFEVYDLSSNNITGAAALGAVGGTFLVQGFGDFSSNPNETDMLLRSDTTGSFEVYDISNNKITFATSMAASGWTGRSAARTASAIPPVSATFPARAKPT